MPLIIIIIIITRKTLGILIPHAFYFLGLLTLQILKTEGLKWLIILIIAIIARFWIHCFISLWLLLTTMINPILSLISIKLRINYLACMLISLTLLFFDNSFDTNMPIVALGSKIGPPDHDSAFRLHLNYEGKPFIRLHDYYIMIPQITVDRLMQAD